MNTYAFLNNAVTSSKFLQKINSKIISNSRTEQRKPQTPKTRSTRILSIDGGGIKGIIPATILCYLEEQLQLRSGNPKARLSDYFDMMVGSSTGGILACLYLTPDHENPTRARLSACQALNLYLENGRAIFDRKLAKKIATMDGMFGQKYSSQILARELQNAIGADITMSQLVRPCILPAYELHQAAPIFFSRAKARQDANMDFYAWEIAQASSSAPTYFAPTSLDKDGEELLLADGGLFAKNPSLHAYLEGQKLAAQQEDKDPNDILLVSIGTGLSQVSYPIEVMKRRGAIAWLKPLMQIMMSTGADIIHQQLEQIFTASPSQYIRLEPGLYEADEAMDNACNENLIKLYEAGRRYVEEHQEEMDALVESLLQ